MSRADKTSATPSRRLAREDWLAIARKTLVASGIDDVKIDRLAKRLQVSRGSFYWHFKSRADLLDALLKDWEVRNHIELAELRDRWAGEKADFSHLVAVWLSEDPTFPAFDVAIRSWASKASDVSRAVHRVDDAWIAILKTLFERLGYQGDDALVRARIVYFHQIGYYALAIRESMEERIRLNPIYYEALTGMKPGASLSKVLKAIKASRKRR